MIKLSSHTNKRPPTQRPGGRHHWQRRFAATPYSPQVSPNTIYDLQTAEGQLNICSHAHHAEIHNHGQERGHTSRARRDANITDESDGLAPPLLVQVVESILKRR